jgi:hypothetical protein
MSEGRLKLPAQLEEIVTSIGIEAAERLLKVRGGVQVYIPRAQEIDESHWLAIAVGMDNAVKLCHDLVGGQATGLRIQLPTMNAIGNSMRRRHMLMLIEQGTLSVNRIASEAGMTRRWVEKTLARRAKADKRQMKLF